MNRIVIIHYHLNPGGVTRIIESQIKALRDYNVCQDILVISGHCDNPFQIKSLGAEIIINEKLNYLTDRNLNLKEEYSSICNFLAQHIKRDDIVHAHNLNLGKNPLLTLAISDFAQRGYLILNHAHDFAEDRNQNWEFLKNIVEDEFGKDLSEVLYSDLPNFMHATLNSFDKRRLIDYGLQNKKVFLLPNPVSFTQKQGKTDSSELKINICKLLNLDSRKKLITYPVRVIRRKNIGEYILLAVLFSEQANWLVTQPPKNPVEIEPYEEWKEFCRKENIKLVFEAGVKTDFEELLYASDFCATTSTKEGFGMVYLEPWLFNTPVIGRDLPQITEDIKKSGIQFPLLYEEIKVMMHGQLLQFSSLADDDQRACISEILNNKEGKNIIMTENSFLEKLLNFKDERMIEKNKSIIKKEYSLQNYAERLEKIYQKFIG